MKSMGGQEDKKSSQGTLGACYMIQTRGNYLKLD